MSEDEVTDLISSRWNKYLALGYRELCFGQHRVFEAPGDTSLEWRAYEERFVHELVVDYNIPVEHPTSPLLKSPVALTPAWFSALMLSAKLLGGCRDLRGDIIRTTVEQAVNSPEEQERVGLQAVEDVSEYVSRVFDAFGASAETSENRAKWEATVKDYYKVISPCGRYERWLERYLKGHQLEWDDMSLGDRFRLSQKVPCDIRCFRIGAPSNYNDKGRCVECGAPREGLATEGTN